MEILGIFNNIINLGKIYMAFILSYFKILFNSSLQFIYQIIRFEKSIDKEIILITGSGGYLGRHLALEFAKRNPTLILWDINEEQNKKTLKELNSNGHLNAHCYTVDLTKQESIKNAAFKVRSKLGNVSMVVMVAAPTFKAKSILDTQYEDIEMHFKLSYLSQLWLIQEFIQPMINKNHGHFVTISSNSALIDLPLVSSYASFKVAQVKLLETLREELAANRIDGIKTTVVYPSILTGGIANGFEESYEMTKDVMVTGVQAAESITHGILKNKDVIYIPKIHRLFSLIKFIFSGRLLGKFVQTKAKINPKFLKLKPKIQ